MRALNKYFDEDLQQWIYCVIEEGEHPARKHDGCSAGACKNPHFARGYCQFHYNKAKRQKGFKTLKEIQYKSELGRFLGSDEKKEDLEKRVADFMYSLPKPISFADTVELIDNYFHERKEAIFAAGLIGFILNEYYDKKGD